jgi:hypothetical protein
MVLLMVVVGTARAAEAARAIIAALAHASFASPFKDGTAE